MIISKYSFIPLKTPMKTFKEFIDARNKKNNLIEIQIVGKRAKFLDLKQGKIWDRSYWNWMEFTDGGKDYHGEYDDYLVISVNMADWGVYSIRLKEISDETIQQLPTDELLDFLLRTKTRLENIHNNMTIEAELMRKHLFPSWPQRNLEETEKTLKLIKENITSLSDTLAMLNG